MAGGLNVAKAIVIVAVPLGLALQAIGFLWYRAIETDVLSCVQSPVPSTCGPSPDTILNAFVYPTIVTGFVIIGATFLVLAWKKGALA